MQNENVFRIDDPYAFLTKELLEKEYVENKLTDKQISEKYNIGSKVTIWRRRKFYNIENFCKNKSNQNACKNRKFSISKDNALLWQQEGKTYFEIAKIVGCSRIVVFRRFQELGLVRETNEAIKNLKWHEDLTDVQRRFLLGDLLGDGNITSWGMFQCNHSYKQLSYIKYKQKILSNLISPNFSLKENCISNHQNGKKYKAYFLRTMGNIHLKEIYNKFYIDKVKIFPYEYLLQSNFDAYSLAIWYMDDGSRSSNTAILGTYGFGFKANHQISQFLFEKFNICSEVKQKHYEGMSFDKDCTIHIPYQDGKFFQLIAPHILPHFQYKLPEKYRQVKQETPSTGLPLFSPEI